MIFPYGYVRRRPIGRGGSVVVIRPTTEPLSLSDAYDQLRLTPQLTGSPEELTHPDDAWITRNITTAREWCEFYTGKSLAPQVRELYRSSFIELDRAIGVWSWDAFGCYGNEILLPGAPIIAIESISYVDDDGSTTVMDPTDYQLDLIGGSVFPPFQGSWPTPRYAPNSVIIRYDCGFALPGDSPDYPLIPEAARSAMLLVLGHLYENRENTTELKLAEIPLGAAALLETLHPDQGLA